MQTLVGTVISAICENPVCLTNAHRHINNSLLYKRKAHAIMCGFVSIKSIVQRLKPEFLFQLLSRLSIELNIDWNERPHRYRQDALSSYLALPDKEVASIEPVLVEIYTLSEWAGADEAISLGLKARGLAIPEEYRKATVLNRAAWLYLNHPNIWEEIKKYGKIDRISEPNWTIFDIEQGLENRIPDNNEPPLERLERILSSYTMGHQGRGKHVKMSYELRNGCDEYYVADLSNYKFNTTVCEEGVFKEEVSNGTFRMAFVYHRNDRTLEALLPNFSMKQKQEICQIWAQLVKNCYVAGTERKDIVYNLKPMLSRNFVFTPDSKGYLLEALPIAIRTSLEGQPNSKRVYKEDDIDIFAQIEKEVNQHTRPNELCQVDWIRIHLLLHECFGRSRSQIVQLDPFGNNILDLNPIVQDPIRFILEGWPIHA